MAKQFTTPRPRHAYDDTEEQQRLPLSRDERLKLIEAIKLDAANAQFESRGEPASRMTPAKLHKVVDLLVQIELRTGPSGCWANRQTLWAAMNKGQGVSKSTFHRTQALAQDLGVLVFSQREGDRGEMINDWRVDFQAIRSLTRVPTPRSNLTPPSPKSTSTSVKLEPLSPILARRDSQVDTAIKEEVLKEVLSNSTSIPSPNTWDGLEKELKKSGVIKAGMAVQTARDRGATPDDLRDVISAWQSRREQWGVHAPFKLFQRLTEIWAPGLLVNDLWPAPDPDWVAEQTAAKERRNAEALVRIAKDRREEFDRGVTSQNREQQVSDDVKPVWDALSAEQQESLAVAVLPRTLFTLFRRRGWQSRLVRDWLEPHLIGDQSPRPPP